MIKDDEKEGEDLSSSQDAAVVQSPPVPIGPVVYDILLFGVTGFTGQLCAEYLMEKEKKTRRIREAETTNTNREDNE